MDTKIKIKISTVSDINNFLIAAQEFESDIDVIYGRYTIDGKSTLGVHSLDLSKPIYVEIISEDKKEIKKFNKVMKAFEVK